MNAINLVHGGIMVNYRCNASCRHCLYACSPTRRQGYVTEEKFSKICDLLILGKIESVHIGGGEPFLDFKGLLNIVRILAQSGIPLDYIETNAFWAHSESCNKQIKILKDLDVRALCISVDPFHAEYVPWGNAVDLAAVCEDAGMDYFLWKQEFIKPLSRLDRKRTHTRQEMEFTLSAGYIGSTASAYRIQLGGRAVNIDEEFRPRKPLTELLNSEPCSCLTSTSHFHADLDGYFIPPGCTGLRLPLQEFIDGTWKENTGKTGSRLKYPIYSALYNGGIAALYRLAVPQGFAADNKGYPSKCNLCFHIREFLAGKGFAELDEDFYTEALKYYWA
ncbi:MAG: radical SAM protein [Treponema sp.]|nr:radical SAM protein [Treponema sp.]